MTDLLTPNQVARLLGVSYSRVVQLDADLRPVRIAGRRYYHREAVLEVAAQRAAKAMRTHGAG